MPAWAVIYTYLVAYEEKGKTKKTANPISPDLVEADLVKLLRISSSNNNSNKSAAIHCCVKERQIKMSGAFILDNDSSLNDGIRAHERLRRLLFLLLSFLPFRLKGRK